MSAVNPTATSHSGGRSLCQAQVGALPVPRSNLASAWADFYQALCLKNPSFTKREEDDLCKE